MEESAIKAVMNGRSKNPRHDTVEKFATMFGVSVGYLLGLSPELKIPIQPKLTSSSNPTARIIAAIEVGWHDLNEAAEVMQFADAEELRQRMERDPPDPVLLARLRQHDVMASWVQYGDPNGIPGGLAILIGRDRPWVSDRVAAMMKDHGETEARTASDDA